MARLLSILTLTLAVVLASSAWGQSPDQKKGSPSEEKQEAPSPDPEEEPPSPDPEEKAAPDAAKNDAAKSDAAKSDAAKNDAAKNADDSKTAPVEAPPAKPSPTKKRPKKQKRPSSPTGTIVVATSQAARRHARGLARAVYRDAVLRPHIDERTAQVLSGNEPPKDDVELARHASVVRALATTQDEEVQRRLAGSLARDLGARLIVLVSVRGGEPTARVVRMPEERMLAVKLTATKVSKAEGAPTWSWSDATSMLRELSIGAPPPGPRKKKKDAGGAALPAPKPDESEDDGNLLTSPWFWGGLGLVVTVGATVLILSQTALNEPDMVAIDGRVVP